MGEYENFKVYRDVSIANLETKLNELYNNNEFPTYVYPVDNGTKFIIITEKFNANPDEPDEQLVDTEVEDDVVLERTDEAGNPRAREESLT